MEKEFLKNCVEKDMTISQISSITNKSATTIRYWLIKYKLKTNHLSIKERGVVEYGETKYCPRCKENVLISDFYQRRGKVGGSTYCKQCTNDQTVERQRAFKQKAIEYKGGKCEKCGYNKYNGALEFHHLNPTQKDFHLGEVKLWTFADKIKKELDKCILVCSNCHREIHGGILN